MDGPGSGGVGTIWSLLDLTPFGRQETTEDSPEGWPQTEPGWFRRTTSTGGRHGVTAPAPGRAAGRMGA